MFKVEDFRYKKHYRTAIIKEIKKRRKEGATFREIAIDFNSEGFETLVPNGKWWAQSIHKLSKE